MTTQFNDLHQGNKQTLDYIAQLQTQEQQLYDSLSDNTLTPEQKQQMQDEFKTLLMRTYAGAFSQVKDQTLFVKPMRGNPDDKEVLVRTEIRGKGEPIQLDYRLEKDGASWKVYDFNVMGVWMGEQYRSSFSQEINAVGIDGLIAKLTERNKANRK